MKPRPLAPTIGSGPASELTRIDLDGVQRAALDQAQRVTSGIAAITAYCAAQNRDDTHREVLGPQLPGAGASGMIVVDGWVLAEWGDPSRPEMAFSVTKSIASLVAGNAFDDGLVELDAPVGRDVDLDQFAAPPADRITWRHLLEQTSGWRGRLWNTGNIDGQDTAYALALHLGPRAEEEHPDRYGRDFSGWDANGRNADNQWTGWWNTGEAIAAEVIEARLPLLPAVSGFVVDVRVATDYDVHPLYPGLVRFAVAEASEELRARYAETRFVPAAGSPWQRLWIAADTALFAAGEGH